MPLLSVKYENNGSNDVAVDLSNTHAATMHIVCDPKNKIKLEDGKMKPRFGRIPPSWDQTPGSTLFLLQSGKPLHVDTLEAYAAFSHRIKGFMLRTF